MDAHVAGTAAHRVDEFIVDVLLRIVDNTLNVARGVIDELPKSDRVFRAR
jgi:hypothetical protein